MPRTAVVIQSNYLPWRGYFDMIRRADQLILLDAVQYTKNDWRNRNLIRTPSRPRWLTIPIITAGRLTQSVDEAMPAGPEWAGRHIAAITANYARAGAYDEVAPWLFGELSAAAARPTLSLINRGLIEAICGALEIATPIRDCTDIVDREALLAMNASERVASLCAAVGAERYLSGPAARAYLDPAPFKARGIAIDWMTYEGYPDYPQCGPAFEPRVSVIDLLLNCGDKSKDYLGAL